MLTQGVSAGDVVWQMSYKGQDKDKLKTQTSKDVSAYHKRLCINKFKQASSEIILFSWS